MQTMIETVPEEPHLEDRRNERDGVFNLRGQGTMLYYVNVNGVTAATGFQIWIVPEVLNNRMMRALHKEFDELAAFKDEKTILTGMETRKVSGLTYMLDRDDRRSHQAARKFLRHNRDSLSKILNTKFNAEAEAKAITQITIKFPEGFTAKEYQAGTAMCKTTHIFDADGNQVSVLLDQMSQLQFNGGCYLKETEDGYQMHQSKPYISHEGGKTVVKYLKRFWGRSEAWDHLCRLIGQGQKNTWRSNHRGSYYSWQRYS